MKKYLPIASLLLAFVFAWAPSSAEAAPACPSNVAPDRASTDPACYTSYSYNVEHSRTITERVWVPPTCTWRVDCRNCGYCCNNGRPCNLSNVCYATFYTKTSGSCVSRWCDNMGSPPGSGYWTTTTRTETWTTTETDFTCHYFTVDGYDSCGDAGTPNRQYATGITWHTRSGTNCTNDPISRYCCNTETPTITADGDYPRADVDLNADFPIDISFVTDGTGYTCNFTAPSASIATFGNRTFTNTGSFTWSRTGEITDPGATSIQPRDFGISCTHTAPGCPAVSNSVRVYAHPQPFTVNITTNPTSPIEVVDMVRWFATPSGGVPWTSGQPYRNYSWSGAVSGSGTYSSSPVGNYIDKRFGVLGTQTARVTVRDRWGQTASDEFTVTIQDTRTPQ